MSHVGFRFDSPTANTFVCYYTASGILTSMASFVASRTSVLHRLVVINFVAACTVVSATALPPLLICYLCRAALLSF
jgi:hypothetical protein